MKLLYLVPGEGMAKEELERRTQVLRDHAYPGTEVDYLDCKNGVTSIESNYEDSLVAPGVMNGIIQAEKDGYDGVLIGCAGDPGLYGAREMVNIPVVGPGENAVHLACMLGNKFTVVAIADSTMSKHEHLVRRAGIAYDRLASIRAANISVVDVGLNPNVTKERVTEEALCARDDDGADCIILGCLSLAFQLFDRELSIILGIPVINPAISGLKQLESLVATGMSHSKKAYLVPPKYRK